MRAVLLTGPSASGKTTVAKCLPHAQIRKADGRPGGAAFSEWASRVRQPVNSRVLSLRGLPELVRLELAYAIGCRAAEQVVVVVTGGMRPWIDQLRAVGLGSVTEFDLSVLDGVGDKAHVRFALLSDTFVEDRGARRKAVTATATRASMELPVTGETQPPAT